ncbi:glycosyltransferase family 2 protein [Streptomyces canus]|uniref:Glycosyltransferase involved in cell wall biosynthesis n=1 Tax=Streptomyces canus TaxID=58343 RepID=A0AAW8FFS2_9ACTN|nr:glycosyltransferase family 2 protein [Streptomyces canus]MDQ0908096.1 glycosyltransferase involved in cell wall biosynthesis [Streptomyces canus]MDQ1068067.1 glycosyltransferase involved in cell wall biosynthesis [Streptomyces canus]
MTQQDIRPPSPAPAPVTLVSVEPEPERGRPLISYVLPVYNERDGITAFHTELTAALDSRPELDFELVYVNDGSTDGSLELLKGLAERDGRVRVVDFARNFGHQLAITAGLDLARGDAVIVMDTDLQDPPKVSLELVDAWREGAEIVHARRRSRQDSAFKRATAHLYYRVLRSSTDVDIPLDTGDFRLLDRRVADELRRYRERSRFVRGIVASMGYRQTEVAFDRDERFAGETKYPLRKMARLAIDGVTSFSTAPLKMITRLGFVVLALSLLGILYALAMKFFRPEITVSGWTMLMCVVLFLGGTQMLSLGVIGAYIGRIYSEAQGRPLYLVREVVGGDGDH